MRDPLVAYVALGDSMSGGATNAHASENECAAEEHANTCTTSVQI